MGRGYRAQGYQAVKLRFGRTSEDSDIAALAAVREAVGDDMAIMVDLNHGWRMPWDTHPVPSLEEVMALEERTREHGLFWLEEPLHRGDYPGMRALRDHAQCRIAGGEVTRELHEFAQILRDGCLDVYQPDVVFVGGMKRLIDLGLKVFEEGFWFTPHTWGNGLGVIVNAHLVAAVGGRRGQKPVWLEFAHDPPEFTETPRDVLLSEPLTPRDGLLQLSDQPGWGVALNEQALADTRVA
jgi:L-alanine-DL-glutamate epimerase-like enolase superfamily enzyme